MDTLAVNKTHNWGKNTFSKITLKWSNENGTKTGSVSLTIGDNAASSKVPPALDIAIDKRETGKIVNNTSQTITYTLS